MERWRWNVVFSTHSSQHSRVCVFSHNVQDTTVSSLSNFTFTFVSMERWKHYFLVSNRRRVTTHAEILFLRPKKKYFGVKYFFLTTDDTKIHLIFCEFSSLHRQKKSTILHYMENVMVCDSSLFVSSFLLQIRWFYIDLWSITVVYKSKKTRIWDFLNFFIAAESGAESKGALLGRRRAKHRVHAILYSYKI